MGTYESGKLKELRTLTTIRDRLFGTIPKETLTGNIVFSKVEVFIFSFSSFILIIVSLLNYFYFDGNLYESIAMFITGIIFIAYYLRQKKSKK
jgi:hypothetical protein